MRNHYARHRNHHSRLSISFPSLAASRLRLSVERVEPRFRWPASRGCSKWRSTMRSNCTNLFRRFERLSEQMSQPNHSNVNAQVSRIFGRWQFNREPQASSSHFRRLTNIRRIGISNIKEQDEQVKIEVDTKRSIFV